MKSPRARSDIKGRLRDLEVEVSDIVDHDRHRVVSKRAKDYVSKDTGEKITSDEFCTPPSIARPLYQFFGGPVGIDPCSNPRSIVQASLTYCEGGLIRPWCRPYKIGKGDTGYANWPYSQNDAWSAKAIRELQIHNLSELVVLCMTSTSTQWWSSLMNKPKRNPRVLCLKRQRFLGPDGKPEDSSRFDPSIIYYGRRTAAFDREFKQEAMWSTWGR